MNIRWRVIGFLVLLAGFVYLVVRSIRHYLKEGASELPPPDRIIGGRPGSPQEPQEPQESVGVPAEETTALEPPPPRRLVLPGPGVSFGTEQDTQDSENLWQLLQQETFRHRGEGFKRGWAFHLYAAQHHLGAPLALTASKTKRVAHRGREYGFQVFAGDTLFNEIPRWNEVRSLNALLNGTMPDEGLPRLLLDASYRASGTTFHDNWAFHQRALAAQLGPALREARRITVDGAEYSVQVFARDTLYNQVPHWNEVQQLSETPASNLADALWQEAYAVADATYEPDSPFHQKAAAERLGTPISGAYQINLDGNLFRVQVFAAGTLYASHPDGPPLLQRDLVAPDLPEIAQATGEALNAPDDALSDKRPLFTLLPIAGQPPISQLYGYTRFAAGAGRGYYTSCQGRHPGIDFAVPVETPLLAIGHGLVVWSGTGSPFASGPRSIVVRYGAVYAIYGHVSSEAVQRGNFVTPGQAIGASGPLGGPHLHFELRDVPEEVRSSQDPMQAPTTPGFTTNPIDFFSEANQAYFERWYGELGKENHFCIGSLRDQKRIVFGGPLDTRPCTNG